MSFTAQGSSLTWDTGNPSFTPHAVGDLVVAVFITKLATTPSVTGLSSSNVTWTKVGGPYTGTLSNTNTTIWLGKVTSVSAATQTITWSSGSEPAHWQANVRQFTVTHGDWSVDKISAFDHNSSNNAYPSLTPNAAGELYYGSHFDNSGASAGSTSGYTYFLDSHGNGMAFNPNCGSGAQAPTWADTAVWGGAALLIQERVSGTSAVALKKMTVVAAGPSGDTGTAAVTLKKMSVSGTATVSLTGTTAITLKKMTVSGTATAPLLGTAIITLKKMVVSGSSSSIVSGTTDVTLKKMTVSGTATAPLLGTAAITIKKMVVTGSSSSGISGTVAVTLKKMTVSSSGFTRISATGAPKLKKMTAVGIGKAKSPGTIAVTIRKMTVSGTGHSPIPGTIAVTLLKMQVIASDGHAVGASSLFIFSLF